MGAGIGHTLLERAWVGFQAGGPGAGWDFRQGVPVPGLWCKSTHPGRGRWQLRVGLKL